jgi:RNA-directed DNA polymerase
VSKETTTVSEPEEEIRPTQWQTARGRIEMLCPGIAHLRQKLGEKAKREPKFRFYSLYGHICRIETLRLAWKLIRGHGQTPGIDGITYEDIERVELLGVDSSERYRKELQEEQRVEAFLNSVLEELKNKTYEPMPVRRVYIPKPDGRKRPLGIPTIKDRLVQMAVLLFLEPIFEADFLDCSYGFRPNISAHHAIQEIMSNLRQGRVAVYDADMKGYFDSIPHDKLMLCVKMRIADKTVLGMIEKWLKAPIVEKEKDGKGGWQIKVTKPSKGTPQGGVISPLLANVYLHWFDKSFHRKDGPRNYANARLIRYADDFVILALWISERIKDSAQHLLEKWLGLEINKEKTRVVTLRNIGDSIDFLGYTFRVEQSYYGRGTYVRLEPKKGAVKRAKERIRELTSRSMNWVPIGELIGKINNFTTGWGSYFMLGQPNRVFRAMDNYVRIKVTNHLKRRSEREHRKPKKLTWYAYLKKRGLQRLSERFGRRPPESTSRSS